MNRIDDFLFKISGYKPRLREGQFIVDESILFQANEAYESQDYETCIRIWTKYANLNNGISLLRLSQCYWIGSGVDVNYEKSFDLLKKATLLIGGTQNYFNLGVGYQVGLSSEQSNYKSFFFYVCAFHHSLENEIDLKDESKQRMDEVYKLLNDEDKQKADLLLGAIDSGFIPAGMDVALELLHSL